MRSRGVLVGDVRMLEDVFEEVTEAYRMPPQQPDAVLKSEWGADWRRRFARFDASPIAAASIGQVHRATLPDGHVLAVKVQYPGVRESVASRRTSTTSRRCCACPICCRPRSM